MYIARAGCIVGHDEGQIEVDEVDRPASISRKLMIRLWPFDDL